MNRSTISILALTFSLGLTGCTTLEGVWADLKTGSSSGKSAESPAPDIKGLEADLLAAKAIWSDDARKPSIDEDGPVRLASSVMPPLEFRDRFRVDTGKPKPETVSEARALAKVGPSGDDYLGAIQVYPFKRGSIYQVYGAPEQVTDIALEAGEDLISVSAGDTVRWIVGDTRSGSGVSSRVHILIKPLAEDLSTSLVILTSRRTYYVKLESGSENYMPAVAWSYNTGIEDPASRSSLHLKYASLRPASGTAHSETPVLEQLNFSYRIRGDHPDWRPVRAFDDGAKVYIQFPVSIGRSQAPPLFVKSGDGKNALVNYRVKGRYYVVDRLFDRAELRLGEKKQQVVKIIRDDKS